MEKQTKGKRIISSSIIFIVAVLIVVCIAIGMGALGIPLWPFIFLVFFYTSVDNFNMTKFKGTAIGGLIGIFVGMSQGILTQISGNSILGIVGFAICALVLGSAFIMGDVWWANVFGLLVMTMLTLFSLDPWIWAGIPDAIGMGSIEAFIRVIISYLIGVLLFIIINSVMKKKADQHKITGIQ